MTMSVGNKCKADEGGLALAAQVVDADDSALNHIAGLVVRHGHAMAVREARLAARRVRRRIPCQIVL